MPEVKDDSAVNPPTTIMVNGGPNGSLSAGHSPSHHIVNGGGQMNGASTNVTTTSRRRFASGGSGTFQMGSLTQQIGELLSPASRGPIGASAPIIPVNDVRGIESSHHLKAEKIMRCKLASCYRLVDLFGWSSGIYNHITFNFPVGEGPGDKSIDRYLINPYGLMYHEITASSLLTLNREGEIIDPGSTGLGYNEFGFKLHQAIHDARPSDIRCVIFVQTPDVIAVSAMKCGLLAVSQEALRIGEVSYHNYHGMEVDENEKAEIAKDLGSNKVMFLRNHGLIACGSTVEEAFHYIYNTITAVEFQIRIAPLGFDNLLIASMESKQKAEGLDLMGVDGDVTVGDGNDIGGTDSAVKCGELEYAAFMRHLDSAGFRTGYLYSETAILQSLTSSTRLSGSEVEIPPVAVGIGWGPASGVAAANISGGGAASYVSNLIDEEYESKYGSPVRGAGKKFARHDFIVHDRGMTPPPQLLAEHRKAQQEEQERQRQQSGSAAKKRERRLSTTGR